MFMGELEPSEEGDWYEGISNDKKWRVTVGKEVFITAHHILTMRGIARSQHHAILSDANTWSNDATLRDMSGVEGEAI
jgi:hypothetical protein